MTDLFAPDTALPQLSEEDVKRSVDSINTRIELKMQLSRAGRAAVRKDAVGSAEIIKLPFDKLVLHPDLNVRVDSPQNRAHINSLKESIKIHGYEVSKPFKIFANKKSADEVEYIITDGYCRANALLQLFAEGVEEYPIPCVMEEEGTTWEDINSRFDVHNSGKSLDPIELGIQLARNMRLFGKTLESACREMRITPQWGNRLLTLLSGDDRVKAMVVQDQLSVTLAIEMLEKHGLSAFDMLQQSLNEQQSIGKTRVTAKALAKADPKRHTIRAVTNSAPKMHSFFEQAEALATRTKDLENDPVFKQLSPTAKEAYEALMDHLAEMNALRASIAAEAMALAKKAEAAEERARQKHKGKDEESPST